MRWKAAPPPTPTKHTASPPTYRAAQRFAFESRSPKRLGVAPSDPKAIRRRTSRPQSDSTSHLRTPKQSDARQSMLFRAFAQGKCTKRRNSMDATGLLSRRKRPQVSDLVFCKLIRVWESNVRDESILFRQKVRFDCTNGRFSMDNGHAAALQSRCIRSAATPPPPAVQPQRRPPVAQPQRRPPSRTAIPSHDAPLNRGITARPRRVVKNSRTNRLKRLTGLNRPGIKLTEGNFHTKHLHLLRKSPSTRETYHPDTTVSRM